MIPKPASKKLIEPFTTVLLHKKRIATLAILIVVVSSSVATEIGYAISLAQGYPTDANIYKQTNV